MKNKIKIYLLALKIYRVAKPLYRYINLYKKYDYNCSIIINTLNLMSTFISNNKSLYNLSVNNHFLRGVCSDIQYFINQYKENDLYVSICSSFLAIFKDCKKKISIE